MGGVVRALLAAALITALAGCGARVPPAGLARADAPPSEPAATQEPTPQTQSSPVASEPTAAAAPAVSAPPLGQGPTDPASPHHNNGNIKISLSALCVRPGDVMVATITGPAKAGYAMAAVYADGGPHGAYNAGESDANGVFVWRFPVTPDVPPGRARIYVMATGSNWEGEDGGTADAFFQVAGSEGCGS